MRIYSQNDRFLLNEYLKYLDLSFPYGPNLLYGIFDVY